MKKIFPRVAMSAVLSLVLVGWLGHHWILNRVLGNAPPPNVINVVVAPRVAIRYDFDGAAGTNGVPSPWQSRAIVGNMNADVMNILEPVDQKVLHVRSERSHFIVWNGSKRFDPKEHPILTWSWEAITLPTNADVRTHSEFPFLSANRNDSALQVLVGFEGDNALCYLWDTTAPIGTEVDEWSPVATIKTRVVESGQAHVNQWCQQSVNIYQDYERRFGKPPGKVIGVSVQINSNHTSSFAEGMVGPISAQDQ